ncbi:hypothetical protein RDWZM_009365 [Blomia tropicalis]|uniref:C2H2-type domain-containing protein n=1 Tax=Blomia tropicalis TaxID=40697 RepID=A0A9Q0M195_BLOTA|nr:hypothetical protein RDWZM_009365 [Blomia tropicalis]
MNNSSLDNRKILSDVEQLKNVVNVLLHFKYMLVFIRKKFSVELDHKLKNIAPQFQNDFEFCYNHYNQLIENCIFYDLIQKKEHFYEHNDNYFSFKQHYLFSSASSNRNNVSSTLLRQYECGSISNCQVENTKQISDSLIGTLLIDHNNDIALESSNQLIDEEYGHNEVNQNITHSTLIISECNNFNLNNVDEENSINNVSLENSSNLNGLNKAYTDMPELLLQKNSSKRTLNANSNVYGQKRARQSNQILFLPSSSNEKYLNINFESNEIIEKKTNELTNIDENDAVHVENDLLEVEYWCSFDGCRFKSKSLTQVKAHEERRHVKQIVKCVQDGCDSFFDTKDDLNSHMSDIHSGPLFKCALDLCAKEFNSDYRLKQHIREEHKEEYLTCKLCSKKFKTRKYLTRHFRNVHPEDKFTDEVANSLDNVELKDASMKCTIDNCDKKFDKRSKLKQHIKEEHKEEYLTCKFCDKICKTRNNLTNHIWIMHEEGDFKCSFDDCDFSSKYRKNLLNHKKLRHQRARKCTISDCGEMIPITRYQRHMSSLHKIKNYSCSWPDCGKSFADHNALKNHVRIHLNFKRFKCKWPECGYASEQRFTVITHIRVCHFKLPRTKKKQIEMNISPDSLQNPYDYLEVCREDICI